MPISLGPLGQTQTTYKSQYDPSLLFAVPRVLARQAVNLIPNPDGSWAFTGADFWTAYELSWLGPRGKPMVALLSFSVPSESSAIVESKSLKLYLNSFNQTVFSSADEVSACIERDLTSLLGIPIKAQLALPESWGDLRVAELEGTNLDRLDMSFEHGKGLMQKALQVNKDSAAVEEMLVTRLFKSNCAVTGQPDWASVQIAYAGQPIDQAGLLSYLVSFREHQAFHEPCVERIFMDIWQRCRPNRLSVYARFTRRGGIDINPYRTSYPQRMPIQIRTPRQ